MEFNNLKILIVDDSFEKGRIIQRILKKNLPYESDVVESAEEAFKVLDVRNHLNPIEYKIILMDVLMPGMNGIDATRYLKKTQKYRDIPILMITASNDEETIDSSFKAGAMDYINTTPVRELELLARVNSAIRLYNEMDRRKKREEELLEKTKLLNKTNKLLEKISVHDPLTNLYNRRYLDQFLETEWEKISHGLHDLCVLMVDVDYFKPYNDHYGHQAGDTALKKIADVLRNSAKRGRDLAARYGGEEFCIVLPDTKSDGALIVGSTIQRRVKELEIPHMASPHDNLLTVSIGVSTVNSQEAGELTIPDIISQADQALYLAKKNGRNRVEMYDR